MTESTLVADVGGTNARFALAEPGSKRISSIKILPVADFPSLEAAARAYLSGIGVDGVAAAAMAVAGPLSPEGGELTNGSWRFLTADLRNVLKTERVMLLNDYEALAYSLPYLADSALLKIGGGEPEPRGIKLVMGPGTGLGAAILVPTGKSWQAVPGEAGHVTIPVETPRELAIRQGLAPDNSRRSTEDLVSGPGLLRLYRIIARLDGLEAAAASPAEVAARAADGSDLAAVRAVEQFAVWLGRWAGDLALIVLARGGVYLGGGVAKKLAPVLAAGPLRRAFDDKHRMSFLVQPIPLYIIVDEAPALIGAAAALDLTPAA